MRSTMSWMQAVMSLFERRQAHGAQQVFAQPTARDVGVQQELVFDEVAHALAQPVAAVASDPGPAGDRGIDALSFNAADFLLQLRRGPSLP